MSLENTAKSIAAGFAFSGVAWFSDLVSLGISSLQYSVSSALYASVAGPQVLITAAAGFTAWFLARLGGVDLVEYAQAPPRNYIRYAGDSFAPHTLCFFMLLFSAHRKGLIHFPTV